MYLPGFNIPFSLQYYDKVNNFQTIVEMAMKKIDVAHLSDRSHVKSNYVMNTVRIVYDWIRKYRETDNFSHLINPYKTSKLPPLLNANPDLVNAIIRHCRTNINTLSIESVHHFLTATALPELARTIKTERNEDGYNVRDLLNEYGLKNTSFQTLSNWMRRLGFKYQKRQKHITWTHMKPMITLNTVVDSYSVISNTSYSHIDGILYQKNKETEW